MITLAVQLETVTGKKKYGYLPKVVKKTVDEIVDRMEQLPVINECYQAWWELQCQIEDFYSEKERRRPPLSEEKEFRSIKNAVIQEAESIRIGKVTFEDEEMGETTDFSDLSYDCWDLWMVTQDDTAPMEDRDEAAAQLMDIAENGDPDAQYLIGTLYRDGPVPIPDSVEAHYWFSQSAAQGNEYAQFFLDRWNNLKHPSIMLSVSRLLHHMGRVFREQIPVLTVSGGIQIDRKRLAQLREKKIAMGHKLDDHEEPSQNWTMTMG